MYQVKVNDKASFQVDFSGKEMKVNEQIINWDLVNTQDQQYSIIADGKTFQVIVERIDKQAKQVFLRINNNSYKFDIQEPIDQLLEKMGLNLNANKKVEPIKAPMPGLILKVLVEEGQEIKKGEPVLILEAMKMENVFKATTDAVIKSIKIKEGQAVEKSTILIELE